MKRLLLLRERFMKKTLLLTFAALLAVGAASAQTTASAVAPARTITQKWTTGWDTFTEPLDLVHSNVMWSVSSTRKLTVTFNLVGATPNKLYQVAVDFFCTTFPTTLGQFPVQGRNPDGTCSSATRQGHTATVAGIDVGVVTTDLRGNGSFKVVIGPVPSGAYDVAFVVLNGAGCNLTGGAGNNGCYDDCTADFQSPGPFGTTTTIVVP